MRASIPFVAFVACAVSSIAQAPQVRFDAPIVVVDQWSRIDALVDLDLDGDLDGLGFYQQTASQQSGQPTYLEVKLHRNDGAGRFSSSVLRQWPGSAGAPTDFATPVGDVDGDGHPDVVAILGSTITVFESRPGQPAIRNLVLVPLSTYLPSACDARLLDVTGDGLAELIVVDTSNGLRIFTLGTTTFQQRARANPGPISSTEMVLIEANGDGLVDVAVLDSNVVKLYPATQAGNFTPFSTYVLPGPGIFGSGASQGMICAGDTDNDGDQDLVVFSMGGQYCWLERTAPSQFSMHGMATGGPATDLHDVDGDGDLDGTCCGGGGPGSQVPNYVVGNFEISQNLGSGVFAPAWRAPSFGPNHLAGYADVNGDGVADLVGGRCAFFGPIHHDPVPVVGPSASAVQIADLDRDGDPDTIGAAANTWSNRGDGSFTAGVAALPTAPPGTTWRALPGTIDLDGDGDADILASTIVAGSATATHMLANAGGGMFVDRGPLTGGGTALASDEAIVAADLDADGSLDVLTTESVGIVRVWWGNGATLTPGPSFAAAHVAGVADFTSDNRSDALLASYPLLPNKEFATLQLLAFPSNRTPLVTAAASGNAMDSPGIVDQDGDGDLDLVALWYTGVFEVHVWANGGNGLFTMQPTFALASVRGGGGVRVTDVDGDGLHDFLIGPAGYPHVIPSSQSGFWIVRQVATGVWEPTLYTPEVGVPTDVDGDGDIDVLGSVVVRNLRFDGPSAGSRRQFGDAYPGTGGALPTLGSIGPFRVGVPIETRLTGGMGQSVALVVASLAPAEPPILLAPGFTLYLDAPFILTSLQLGGGPGSPGEGAGSFWMTMPPGSQGLTYYLQAAVWDPSVITSLSLTQALHIRVGS